MQTGESFSLVCLKPEEVVVLGGGEERGRMPGAGEGEPQEAGQGQRPCPGAWEARGRTGGRWLLRPNEGRGLRNRKRRRQEGRPRFDKMSWAMKARKGSVAAWTNGVNGFRGMPARPPSLSLSLCPRPNSESPQPSRVEIPTPSDSTRRGALGR